MQLLEMCKKKQWNNMVPLKLKLSYILILLEQFIFLLERLFQIVLFPPPGNILDKNETSSNISTLSW